MLSSFFVKKRRQWCKGLRAVAALEGLQRRIVVYPRGPAMRTKDGVDVYPCNSLPTSWLPMPYGKTDNNVVYGS